MDKIIVIGASSGGPLALDCLLSGFPKNLGVPVLILQHMPAPFTLAFAERLDRNCRLTVTEAKNKELIQRDHVYIVPGGHHFFFEMPGPRVHLLDESKGLSPSVDMGMISAVDHYGPGVLGVILSGMGKDGLIGAKAVKQIGGAIIAESKESARIFGMPREIIEAGLADYILPVHKIAAKIIELLK